MSVIGRGGHSRFWIIGAGLTAGLGLAVYWMWFGSEPVPSAPPPTANIAAEPAIVDRGSSTILSWITASAIEARLEPFGPVPLNGERRVTPDETTTYRLVATNAEGVAVEDSMLVTVIAPQSPPGLTTIIDDLMWTAEDNGEDITAADARAYCAALALSSYEDWRSPTINELASLFDRQVSYEVPSPPPVQGSFWAVHVKNPIRLTGFSVWSDSESNMPAFFSFMDGEIGNWFGTDSDGRRALCVREP